MIDIKEIDKIHNPFDFSNPVSDENLFIGRKKELNEITYYLDHAKTATKPINIALLGARASGKTSLLNITEKLAQERGFCTVRINLDENDSETLLNFFFKVFDSIIFSACNMGAYGGKQGGTYQAYLDIVSTYNIPENKLFCNFLFPIQYAKAMSSGNFDMQFSDNIFMDDLMQIQSEVKKPIILLFDEGNVLINSRIHLEKLRNMFMNILGFMLIIAGTEELFPIMNDIFSPIIRQFKKIILREFQSIDETEECIEKPLQSIGILKLENLFYINIKEIHDLSGGKPYEIQLICHILFHRIQTKQASNMTLNLSILEDVRKQLEANQDMTSRPILREVMKLNKKQLRSLRTFCKVDKIADFKTIWAFEHIFHDQDNWNEASLKKEFNNLKKAEIIEIVKSKIIFNGDDFDKIYIKYFAREQDIHINFQSFPLEIFWIISLNALIKNSLKGFQELYSTVNREKEVNIERIIEKIKDPKEDVALEFPRIVERLYFLMLNYRRYENIPLFQVNSKLPWFKTRHWYYLDNPKSVTEKNKFKKILKPIGDRVLKFDGKLQIKKDELQIIPVDLFQEYINRTEALGFRKEIIIRLHFLMVKEYISNKNIEEAVWLANLFGNYKEDLEANQKNDIGYVLLKAENYKSSREFLNSAIKDGTESKRTSLPALSYYNLGILEAKEGNIEKAIKNLKLCKKNVKDLKVEVRRVSCLFLPIIEKEKLNFKEVEDPDLLETTVKAMKNLRPLH